MNKCHAEGCNNPIFSSLYCKYHQYMRRRRGGDLYNQRSASKGTQIAKESRKRKIEHKTYLQEIKEFWDESVLNKTDFCFFCGVHMNKRDNVHHLAGRNEKYLDKELFVNCHNSCHLDYHFKSIEWLSHQSWHKDFLARLKSKNPTLYEKELKKFDKSLDFELE
jgi:hypothetical protein